MLKPLPEFEIIDFEGLKHRPASIILQAGSNKLTQWGEKRMGFPYTPAFTHAMIYLANHDVLSMNFNAAIYKIQKLYKKSHRWIIIYFTDMSEDCMKRIIQIAYNRAGSKKHKYKVYDFRGYLGFLTRVFPPIRKVPVLRKFFKGSKKLEFCSDQVVNVFVEAGYPPFIGKDGNLFSPCDIFKFCSTLPGAYFNELAVQDL